MEENIKRFIDNSDKIGLIPNTIHQSLGTINEQFTLLDASASRFKI